MANKFEFNKVLEKVNEVKRSLPIVLANQARNYFLDSFKNQGFDGSKWEEVQRRTEGTKAWKYPQKPKASWRTSPILVRSSKLRRAVSTSIKRATFERITLMVDLPYAKRHNEGLKGMPERTFMKNTDSLQRLQKKTIENKTRTIWRK